MDKKIKSALHISKIYYKGGLNYVFKMQLSSFDVKFKGKQIQKKIIV